MGNNTSLANKPENANVVGLPSTDPLVSTKLSAESLAIIRRFKDVSDDNLDIMTLRGKDFRDLLRYTYLLQDSYHDMHIIPSVDFVMRPNASYSILLRVILELLS